MKQLNLIFKMQRLLKYHARCLKFCDHSEHVLRITGYEEARKQNEDGKTFKYPETLEISFDNWSTTHYSLRIKDNGWVREGRNLMTTKPESTFKVYRNQIREMRAWYAKQNPPKTNVIQFRGVK